MLVSYITNGLVISMWVLLLDACLLAGGHVAVGMSALRTPHPGECDLRPNVVRRDSGYPQMGVSSITALFALIGFPSVIANV